MRTATVFVFLLVGCVRPPEPTAQPLPPPDRPDVVVSVDDLHAEYAENEASAKLRYDGKWVLTVGGVGRVTSESHGYTFLLLENAAPQSTIGLVSCRFGPTQQAALANIPGILDSLGRPRTAVVGRIVEVRRGAGYVRGTNLVMVDCEFRDVPPPFVPKLPDD